MQQWYSSVSGARVLGREIDNEDTDHATTKVGRQDGAQEMEWRMYNERKKQGNKEKERRGERGNVRLGRSKRREKETEQERICAAIGRERER